MKAAVQLLVPLIQCQHLPTKQSILGVSLSPGTKPRAIKGWIFVGEKEGREIQSEGVERLHTNNRQLRLGRTIVKP